MEVGIVYAMFVRSLAALLYLPFGVAAELAAAMLWLLAVSSGASESPLERRFKQVKVKVPSAR